MAQKVMIVDDNPADREIISIVFKEMGRKEKLEFAQSGSDALQLLQMSGDLPALILLDLKLPGISGIETLHQIRTDERLKHVPVVIVSGSDHPQARKEVLEAGADSYLYKSMDMDKFYRDIHSILQRFLKD